MALLLTLALLTPEAFARPVPMQEPKASTTRQQKKPSRKETPKKVATDPDGWKNLFDGKSLDGWKRSNFTGGGQVHVEPKFQGKEAVILVESGASLSGFNWTGEIPKTRYEITLEFLKIEGNDFACGLTFPVEKSHASLILGGWGGSVVGISSIDGQDASENQTTRTMPFPKDHWFKVRLRVTPEKIEAWVDDKKMVDQTIAGRRIGLRFGEISESIPLGFATYQTQAAFRAIRLRRLDAKTSKPATP